MQHMMKIIKAKSFLNNKIKAEQGKGRTVPMYWNWGREEWLKFADELSKINCENQHRWYVDKFHRMFNQLVTVQKKNES